jgi:hypothetical protein
MQKVEGSSPFIRFTRAALGDGVPLVWGSQFIV